MGRSTRSRRSSAPAGAAHDDPAGQPEVAVEPGVQQGAAVHLDGELAASGPPGVGVGLDPQVGAVGVGADDAEPAGAWCAPPSSPRRRGSPPRRTKWRPGAVGHASASARPAKPAASSRAAASAQAWNGRGRGVDEGQHPAGVHRPSLPGSGSRCGGPGPITSGNGRRRGIAAMAGRMWMLRRLNVRTRLIAVIAVPLVLLLAVAVPEALQRRGRADDADRAALATEQVAEVSAAVDAIQGERTLSAAIRAGAGPTWSRRSPRSARSPTTSWCGPTPRWCPSVPSMPPSPRPCRPHATDWPVSTPSGRDRHVGLRRPVDRSLRARSSTRCSRCRSPSAR